jgi:hypothetical protein
MNWATRAGVHIDRSACAWLIRRFIDENPTIVCVADDDDVPDGAICFDMPGAALGHRDGGCTFETLLRRFDLTDPVLWRIAQAVHQADLDDDIYDAPEAGGLDIIVRGLSLLRDDEQTFAVTAVMFDGLYEYHRQAIVLGREPA